MKKQKHDDGIAIRSQLTFPAGELLEKIKIGEFDPNSCTNNIESMSWIQEIHKFAKQCRGILIKAEEADLKELRDKETLYRRDLGDDIQHLEGMLENLETCIQENNIEGVAYFSYKLGIRYQRLRTRLESPHLRRGQKVLQSAREGHTATHGTRQEKQAKWKMYKKAYEEHKRKNPHLSNSRCIFFVAQKYAVHPKTILRHL